MKTQSQLDKLADRIEAAKVESADAGVSGFFVDAKRNVLRVYWKGAVSSAATKKTDGSGIELGVSGLPAGADHAYALTALPALASSIATDIAAMAAPEVADR